MIWKCPNEWPSDPFRKPDNNTGELFTQNESSRMHSEQLEADTITSREFFYDCWSCSEVKEKMQKLGTPDGRRSIFRPIETYIWLGHLIGWVAEMCWKSYLYLHLKEFSLEQMGAGATETA